MERNRGDWNDGCDYAQTGLGNFSIENAQDREIYDAVSSCFEDFEDGRVFRDIEWSYSAIYKLADPELLKDMQAINEQINEY